MGGELAAAANVLAQVKRDGIESRGGTWPAEEEAAFKAPIQAQYERQGHPYYSSARLWDDGVIDPADHPHGAGAGHLRLAQRARAGDTLRVFRM